MPSLQYLSAYIITVFLTFYIKNIFLLMHLPNALFGNLSLSYNETDSSILFTRLQFIACHKYSPCFIFAASWRTSHCSYFAIRKTLKALRTSKVRTLWTGAYEFDCQYVIISCNKILIYLYLVGKLFDTDI